MLGRRRRCSSGRFLRGGGQFLYFHAHWSCRGTGFAPAGDVGAPLLPSPAGRSFSRTVVSIGRTPARSHFNAVNERFERCRAARVAARWLSARLSRFSRRRDAAPDDKPIDEFSTHADFALRHYGSFTFRRPSCRRSLFRHGWRHSSSPFPARCCAPAAARPARRLIFAAPFYFVG